MHQLLSLINLSFRSFMKKIIFAFILFCSFSLIATEETLTTDPEVTINVDQLSETFGHLFVRHLCGTSGVDFSIDKVIQGMKDEKENKPSPLTEEQFEQMMAAWQEKVFAEVASKNLQLANAFLTENKSKEGIVVANEKLQYEVLEMGSGEQVTSESTPLIHYEGKLLDGTRFASSIDNGTPTAISLKQTIAGFSQGLTGMLEGEKRILYVHPDLAYGASGHLPPNSLLIFEVKVLKANQATEVPEELE